MYGSSTSMEQLVQSALAETGGQSLETPGHEKEAQFEDDREELFVDSPDNVEKLASGLEIAYELLAGETGLRPTTKTASAPRSGKRSEVLSELARRSSGSTATSRVDLEKEAEMNSFTEEMIRKLASPATDSGPKRWDAGQAPSYDKTESRFLGNTQRLQSLQPKQLRRARLAELKKLLGSRVTENYVETGAAGDLKGGSRLRAAAKTASPNESVSQMLLQWKGER